MSMPSGIARRADRRLARRGPTRAVSPRRHLLTAGAAWLVLSVIGVALVAGAADHPASSPHARRRSRTGAFVLLARAVRSGPHVRRRRARRTRRLRFRATDDLDDGPPIHGHDGFQAIWLGTSASCSSSSSSVTGPSAWSRSGAPRPPTSRSRWRPSSGPGITSTPNGVKSTELHIPVDRRVHLLIKSDRRHPFLLGPGLRREAGRRPGPPDPDLHDRHEAGDLSRDVR